MPKYTFTFKKDDIFVEFSTEDKETVERQFQMWVSDADDYVNNGLQPSVKPEKVFVKKEEEKLTEKIEKNEPEIKPVVSEPEFEPAQIKEEPEQSTEQAEILDKASSLLKTINTIQNPPEEENKEEPEKQVGFEDVLDKTIENPSFEPNKTQDQVFLNLIKSKNTEDKFHYLMITAYYLSEFEKLERFSLKQINAKLMQNLSEIIDHTMLQNAINQNFIELVPDLTGISEINEYRLTRAGEEFFAKI